jgi:Uma2 family endonuclease
MPAVLDSPRRKRSAALPPLAAPHDHLTVVWDTTWPFYLQLDAKLEGSSSRVSYLKGRLDIMTLSIDHERIKGNLSHLIATHCLDEDVEFATQGSATLRIRRDRGKEPDDSFVFGELKKTRPDMVLEVVISSGAIDKLEFYAPFRIPEVWVWESAGLNVFVLDGGRYRKAKKSKLLPKFDVSLAGSLATCQSTSQAVREFRKGRSK